MGCEMVLSGIKISFKSTDTFAFEVSVQNHIKLTKQSFRIKTAQNWLNIFGCSKIIL